MNREGHKNINFFIGPEVEHTPAYSKKTLFVVGEQDIAEIERLAKEHKITHIFMGANHSYNSPSSGYWDKTITALLDKGLWVTLDYPAHKHEDVLNILNKNIWQSRQFVPLLNVQIPNVQTSNSNLTVKIDDIDFEATNPGVWCMHFHEITDSNRFTAWGEYGSDVVIENLGKTVEEPNRPIFIIDTNKPDSVEQPRETEVVSVKNETNLGLDLEAKSKLRPEVIEETLMVNMSSEDAAAAYVGDVKTDPLSGKKTDRKTITKK